MSIMSKRNMNEEQKELNDAKLEAAAFKSCLDRIMDLTGDASHQNENCVLGVKRVVKERKFFLKRLYNVYVEAGGELSFTHFKDRELELMVREGGRAIYRKSK